MFYSSRRTVTGPVGPNDVVVDQATLNRIKNGAVIKTQAQLDADKEHAERILAEKMKVAGERKARMKELDVPYVYLGQSDKVATLNKLIQELGIKLQQVAYVGDDIPDLACMQAVGLSIAVHDAHQTVRKQADWRTTLPGGRGAVREVCDLLIDAQQVVQS